jgi:hypothetical protein
VLGGRRSARASGDDAVRSDTLVASVRGACEQLEASPHRLDVGVVRQVLEYQHQVALNKSVGTTESLLAPCRYCVNYATSVFRVGCSGEVPLVDEAVHESGDALFAHRDLEGKIRLDRSAALQVLQDPVLRY